ncbi:methionine--tRNA ligase, mitochondrial isoform X1 [Drosophila novamexicana]|uniref:methionine--tRNA ligase, mitochondrial isoform X1 n=1 Tax=Drosophila novamexicana TaxID=47314 RepID=UPI0011E5A34B|nr:methionine--tRNA ligase, mitochondrial isoform X1 [Drosophila novamexicana]
MLVSKVKYIQALGVRCSSSHYVTTPIFYVNAAPHIGHLYSAVIADAHCRYQRLRHPERKVRLCTGTDEHGTKIQQAAAAHKVPVGQYCDEVSARYRDVFRAAGIEHDDFIRTTEQRHKQAVAHFWHRLQSRGHIYSAAYSGWYCVSDETFLTESQLRLDATSGTRYSLESGHPVEWTEETNYMFRLSQFQDDVRHWVQQEACIRPAKFQKILLDTLSEPLPDVSVSRPANRVHWAIPVPNDDTQTVYVWLDALINYLSSLGYPNEQYLADWPPAQQIIGKDILKFHGIYWPAFLLAAGLAPPQQLHVHSHWTVDGQKMSKSKHNVVDPVQAAQQYTMEGLRYFLLREGVAHSDGNYSHVKALRILNSELADTLGNLLSRACAKSLNPQQIYPEPHVEHLPHLLHDVDAAKRLQEALLQLEGRCEQHYEGNHFHLVADTAIAALHAANNFFECAKPWELKAGGSSPNPPRLQTIIAMTMDALRLCGIVLQPMMPQLTSRLLDKLNVPTSQRSWRHLQESFATTTTSTDGVHKNRQLDEQSSAHLFQRILEHQNKPAEQQQQQQSLSHVKRTQSKKERKTTTRMS